MIATKEIIAERSSTWLAAARSAMQCEAAAIEASAARLDESLLKAVGLILNQPGKVIVTGLGKSGLVGQKIAATLCSTGTPAVFLHPADALHGDLGVYAPGDPTILISKSGATAEILRLVPTLREFDSALIGVLGNMKSPLAEQVDVVLDGTVDSEADPCGLAPTSSAVVAMALGDALASALMEARHFTQEDFARYHGGGQLGRNLLATVREALHPLDAVACVGMNDSVKAVVLAMTSYPLGAACVLTADGSLAGIITDGDLRRALQAHDDLWSLRASDIMTVSPISVRPDAKLMEALQLMENRPSQISVLPVIEPPNRCLGLIRIHDIYNPGLFAGKH
jgi:arabinose-5-phosphate isomerase